MTSAKAREPFAPLPSPASRLQQSSACASPSSRGVEPPLCRCARPSSGRRWRSYCSSPPSPSAAACRRSSPIRPCTAGTGATRSARANDVPPQAIAALERDHDVQSFSGWQYNAADIDGVSVPFLATHGPVSLTPPILSGHALEASNQIVLGPSTLAALHEHVGDTVVISYGSPGDYPIYVPPTKLRIVGTATFPAYGSANSIHTSMGTGAWFSFGILPAAMEAALTSPEPTLNGPEVVFVKLRSGVSAATGRASLERIVALSNRVLAKYGDSVLLLGVQRPAEIVNYRSMGSTPSFLAAALALGALVALGVTLSFSVRRRRRDLALLKVLGFTRRQLAGTVAWQASIVAIVGIVVGVPSGIAIGRWLWILFARSIAAVPDPTVPILAVTAVGIGRAPPCERGRRLAGSDRRAHGCRPCSAATSSDPPSGVDSSCEVAKPPNVVLEVAPSEQSRRSSPRPKRLRASGTGRESEWKLPKQPSPGDKAHRT